MRTEAMVWLLIFALQTWENKPASQFLFFLSYVGFILSAVRAVHNRRPVLLSLDADWGPTEIFGAVCMK